MTAVLQFSASLHLCDLYRGGTMGPGCPVEKRRMSPQHEGKNMNLPCGFANVTEIETERLESPFQTTAPGKRSHL